MTQVLETVMLYSFIFANHGNVKLPMTYVSEGINNNQIIDTDRLFSGLLWLTAKIVGLFFGLVFGLVYSLQ